MTVLTTERLTLRPTGPDLFDGFWGAIERSLPELRQWMPWAIEPDPERTRGFLRRAAEEWEQGHERHFTLVRDDHVWGQCSLDHSDPLHSSYEMGYWLRSDLCGRGLMTEAARAVVNFGFDEMKTHRIELHAGIENVASNRVAEKLGFTREGLLREACLGVDGFYDAYVYGLLKTDPRPRS